MPNNRERMAERKAMRIKVSVPRSKKYPLGWYWFAQSVPADKHGEWGTYNNWYCRCPPCRDANHLHTVEQGLAKSQ